MAALTPKQVRERVDNALNSAAGFRRSRYTGYIFGSDPRQVMHGSFAVDVPATNLNTGAVQRQKTSEGLMANTAVQVKVAGRYRPDAQRADMDTLLTLEASAVVAVEGISRADLHILYEGARRELSPASEFAFTTITFRAIHRLALA